VYLNENGRERIFLSWFTKKKGEEGKKERKKKRKTGRLAGRQTGRQKQKKKKKDYFVFEACQCRST